MVLHQLGCQKEHGGCGAGWGRGIGRRLIRDWTRGRGDVRELVAGEAGGEEVSKSHQMDCKGRSGPRRGTSTLEERMDLA